MSFSANHEDFSLSLAADLNSTATYENYFGLPSIGFSLVIPTGATVVFEGSFDGTNFFGITMRSQNIDLYVQSSTISDDLVGSISSLRSVRCRVTVAGSAPGSFAGRATAAQSTIEGIEHGHPPHKRGFAPIRKDFTFTTTQTGAAVWTPVSGKKLIITSYLLFGSGTTDATVTIFDGTNSTGNRLLVGFFDVTVNSPISISAFMGDSPFISAAANNVLRYTSDAAIDVFGILFGYEV